MSSRPDGSDLLALAVDVAREAGDLLVRGRAGVVTTAATKSSPTDVVTELDRASEALVARRLREARPGDGILGEEGSDVAGTTGVRWVVDPLDGTVNFLYDLPNWAVSIAAEVDGVVVAGVVHAPALGLTYTGLLGSGSFRDGRRLTGSTATDLGQALVATGFGYGARRRAAQSQVLTRVLPRVRDIRRLGAAALDLCSAAEGRVDAYYERGLKPWDLAAGGLIVRCAGLVVGGLDGREAGEDLVVAAPPALFGPLAAILSGDPRADQDEATEMPSISG